MTRYTKLLFLLSLMLILLSSCKQPMANSMLTVDETRCVGCGECEEVCPYNAIEVVDGDAVIDPGLCHQCNRCVEICPEGAIY